MNDAPRSPNRFRLRNEHTARVDAFVDARPSAFGPARRRHVAQAAERA